MLHAFRQWCRLPARTRALIARHPHLLTAFERWHRFHTADNLREYPMTTPAQANAVTSLVQAFLPRSLYPRAKAIVAGALSVLSAVAYLLPYLSGVPAEVGNVIGVVINVVLTPLATYFTENVDVHAPEHEAAAVAIDGTPIPPAQD